MSDLAVKIQNEDDVRRVNLKSTRFSDLLEIISTLFGIRAEQYRICYLDEDKDSITVTTDLELKEALALAKKTNSTLRLLIKESKGPKVITTLPAQQPNIVVKESSKESSQSNILSATGTQAVFETINEGITALDQVANPVKESQKKVDTPQLYEHEALCDICKNKISGIRYKCGNCDDFDLCEKCESLRLHDTEHIFLKLYKDISPVSKALLPLLYVPKPEPPKPNREPLNAVFIKDVTMEEGTILKKSQTFTKIWKLQNCGKEAWTPGCRLVMTEGSSLGTVNFVEVPCAKPGEEIDISVDLIAPNQPGRYVSYWRLSDSNGIRFGHRIWVDIVVVEDKPEPIAQPVVTQPISIPVFQPISQPVVAQPVVSDPIPVPVDSLITGPMFQVKVSEKSLKIRDSTSLVDVEFIITKENELVFRVTATKEVRMQHHLTHLKRWAVIENAITLDFAEWESGFITLQTPIASQIGSLISNRIESILQQAVPNPAPVPTLPTVQPVVEVPKVPEPIKEVLPEGITESDMEKLAELGFTDRKRNIDLLVKHKRDIVQVVTALLES